MPPLGASDHVCMEWSLLTGTEEDEEPEDRRHNYHKGDYIKIAETY